MLGTVVDKKPFSLKTYQFFQAEDGSHLLLEFASREGVGLSFTMSSEDAKQMGEELIKQALLLQPGKKANI